MSTLEPQPDLNQREFLKKLVGTAAGVAGFAAASQILNPPTVEAAYLPGSGPLGADLVNTSLSIQGPRPWIDVTAYGAVGNGSGNDRPFIQNALNAVPATGGTVFFPPGRYICDIPLTLSNKHIHIRGAGRGVSTIHWTGATGGLDFTFSLYDTIASPCRPSRW